MISPLEDVLVPMRSDVRAALNRAWANLGKPGAWLDGAQRIAVAAEARQAWVCRLCAEKKGAVSPYIVEGVHDHRGGLADAWVDLVHPVVTDSGRLTKRWYDAVRATGVGEDEFVEILSVAIITTVVDAFCLGIGLAPPPLPWPEPGAPHRIRTAKATPGPGWISTIAPENAGPELADFYAGGRHFYIRRALSLVPDEVRRFWDLMDPLYMPDPRIRETDGLDRDILRAQIEFLAARTSVLHGCFF